MIKILQVRNVDIFVESRRQKTSAKDRKIVQAILDDVRKNGDAAVKKYEQKFNGRKTTSLRVSKKEIKEAKITQAQFYALRLSALRLSEAQRTLKKRLFGSVSKLPGVSFLPISTVGCYVPGGQARYPSSAIMSTISAAEAGVKRIIVISPPDPDGNIDPMTVFVAQRCGAEIYKVGGAPVSYTHLTLPTILLV